MSDPYESPVSYRTSVHEENEFTLDTTREALGLDLVDPSIADELIHFRSSLFPFSVLTAVATLTPWVTGLALPLAVSEEGFPGLGELVQDPTAEFLIPAHSAAHDHPELAAGGFTLGGVLAAGAVLGVGRWMLRK